MQFPRTIRYLLLLLLMMTMMKNPPAAAKTVIVIVKYRAKGNPAYSSCTFALFAANSGTRRMLQQQR